jgi:hypothetical protein
MGIFAVIRSRGAGWDASRPMEQQDDWHGHAEFMNALQQEGFVVLGGPLVGTPDTLLIIHAEDPEQIAARLADDCWSRSDLLRLGRIAPWQLRLGSLD